MDVFDLRKGLVKDYREYTKSFININDPQIKGFVDAHLDAEGFWPQPLLQLNPTFAKGDSIDELVSQGVLHQECSRIFRTGKSDEDHHGKELILHKHQDDAIRKAKDGLPYVLTTGTGSGKSLAYIIPIVDYILRSGRTGQGIQAIIVYPMNALANSQEEELAKFINTGYPEGAPLSFGRYTSQEKDERREKLRQSPPDILLTNFMMLELMLTRGEDRNLVMKAQGLKYLVFDELHTYRGRQGADVAMLIRRCQQAFGNNMICVGTSATMASGGTIAEQRKEVAKVAQKMFGVDFTPNQVIPETLERATPEIDVEDEDTRERLQAAVARGKPPANFQAFRNDPLTSWIESTFGVQREPSSGKLQRREPRPLTRDGVNGRRRADGAPIPKGAAEELSQITGAERDQCEKTLRAWLLKGSGHNGTGDFPVFPFRLHQFLSRGDTVWATMEPFPDRHLEISKKAAKPGEADKPLFPLIFCRHCGVEYYRISKVEEADDNRDRLIPREDYHFAQSESETPGYLHFLKKKWPAGDGPELLERLPSDFKVTNADGEERIKPDVRNKDELPRQVWINTSGKLVSEGAGAEALFVRHPFRFCLKCLITYPRRQKAERFKMSTLGVDNRSTATTIVALRSLMQLRGEPKERRKLLSFTDNRQDASLQAGHFNDFVQVVMLRSALYQACKQSGDAGLGHGDLADAVFSRMDLNFDDYAADAGVVGPAKTATKNALRRVIEYFLYRDLEKGWRVTAPNLEDSGLLRFEYSGLTGDDGLLQEDALWTDGFESGDRRSKRKVDVPAILSDVPTKVREQLIRTLLDVLRHSLAVKVDVLDPEKHRNLVNDSKSWLLEGTVWHLEDHKNLTVRKVAYPRSRERWEARSTFAPITSYSAYGQYLKRELLNYGDALRREGVDEVIRFLFLALKRYGIVEQVRSRADSDAPGYQINPGALRWLPGDGTTRALDMTRLSGVGTADQKPNPYFVKCYKNFVDQGSLLEAREHTAQVPADQRVDREERFREGDLPLLFCSPTMELGVDIAELNLVNLRNIPPTPANYAQRSGRAGRSGKSALVSAYCAGRSPHDQYFYRNPAKMVSGTVAPPQIDLCNRDLIRSHIHAVWMEVAKPDLGKTLNTVIDLKPDDGSLSLRLKQNILDALRYQPHRAETKRRVGTLIKGIHTHLEKASWFNECWAEEVVCRIEKSFDSACDRWRSLYRSAHEQRRIHHAVILDLSRPEHERKRSRQLRAQAEAQIDLLTNAKGMYEGDFYSYRYLATEGFLPGYNFPRLPISAFVPGRKQSKTRDEYISRSRFLAISEFGPRAMVYHEGAMYEVARANIDFGANGQLETSQGKSSLPTGTMKRCQHCGYAHYLADGNANLAELCNRCEKSLDPESRIGDLVRMHNVTLRMRKRITCNEEERQRLGYDLVTAYHFSHTDSKQDRKDADLVHNQNTILKLFYGDAVQLYRINQGWAQGKGETPKGFTIDLESFRWQKSPKDQKDKDSPDTPGQIVRVVPFVEDTKNALVMRFAEPLDVAQMAGLQAAFKQAIQQHFQIEPRELVCEPMPDAKNRREILFYEASEGGAGCLRQLVDDPKIMPKLARLALEVCHYNPKTLEDQGTKLCGKACYGCLLDYGNQRDHLHLDRSLIKEILATLAESECKPAGGAGSRRDRFVELSKQCDSKLEKRWLQELYDLGLRLPSHAQYGISLHWTRPDFFYEDTNTAVYIDGPPHDSDDQAEHDKKINDSLIGAGYAVIRFHYRDDWKAKFKAHPDIFGEISG